MPSGPRPASWSAGSRGRGPGGLAIRRGRLDMAVVVVRFPLGGLGILVVIELGQVRPLQHPDMTTRVLDLESAVGEGGEVAPTPIRRQPVQVVPYPLRLHPVIIVRRAAVP